jgi:RNA polymerase sigma factor (TIGR02999 family)
MTEITALLETVDGRAGSNLGAVFDLLYADLKRIAAVRLAALAPGQTLGATALVHEAYLKLVGAQHLKLASRQHFFACAARAMRQILVDRARSASAEKHGGAFEHVTLGEADVASSPADLFDIDRALDDLELLDPALRELVELRYFAGLSLPQIAELREVSLRTAARDWARARALLEARLG